MKALKYIYRALISLFPGAVQSFLSDLYFCICTPKLLRARASYQYSDEHKKFVHIMEAMNYLRVAGAAGRVLPQNYFEFGCHSARTFSAAVNASIYLGMNSQFYAFDSFEGLPEIDKEQDGYFQTGTFCTSLKEFLRIVRANTGLKLPNFTVVKGFYCDSLTTQLQARMPMAGVVYIDVDLYSSTIEVLNFLKPLLVSGTLLIFDDWYCFPPEDLGMGERRALTEFLKANSEFAVEPWRAYSTFGQSFFVIKSPNIF